MREHEYYELIGVVEMADPVGRELALLGQTNRAYRTNHVANERQPVRDKDKCKAKRKLQRKARKGNRS